MIDFSNRIYALLSVFILVLIVFFGVRSWTEYRNGSGDYPREISVTARGKAYAKPDIATITLGVMSEGKDAQVVVTQNTDKMNAITAKLKALGIEDKDLQTTNYYLTPVYDYSTGVQRRTGYSLSQELRVKIRDFSKISSVLSESTTEGANFINELQFTIDEMDKVKAVALEEAIKKAREKATLLANASGLKLGKLVNVYEEYNPEPYPYNNYAVNYDKGMGGGVAESMVGAEISTGQQEIEVGVTLSYRIR